MPAPTDSLHNTLESKGVSFHIKTGNSKWKCTLLEKGTHERQKAERTDSSSSVQTLDSTTSSSSSSTTKSQ